MKWFVTILLFFLCFGLSAQDAPYDISEVRQTLVAKKKTVSFEPMYFYACKKIADNDTLSFIKIVSSYNRKIYSESYSSKYSNYYYERIDVSSVVKESEYEKLAWLVDYLRQLAYEPYKDTIVLERKFYFNSDLAFTVKKIPDKESQIYIVLQDHFYYVSKFDELINILLNAMALSRKL